jgi:hypothetical protein
MLARPNMNTSILLPFLSLLLASNAPGADRGSNEREAKRACLNGDFAKGVAILTDLFVDTGEPTYIYNQGRCFEQNERYQEAIGRFREYLRKVSGSKTVDTAEKGEAEKHIRDCQALLAEKDKAGGTGETTKPVPPPVSPSLASPGTDPTSEPVAAVAKPAAAPTATGSPGSGLRIAGIATASLGVAALVTGLLSNLKANSMVRGLTPTYNKSDDSSSQSYKTLSVVGYTVGGVCLAGGAVLYYLGWRAGSSSSVALLPSFAAGSASAVLAGVF